LARQPRVHARVRPGDLVEAQVEAPRDVGNRVFVAGVGHLQLAHDAGGLRIKRESVRCQRLLNRWRRRWRWWLRLARHEKAAPTERQQYRKGTCAADHRSGTVVSMSG